MTTQSATLLARVYGHMQSGDGMAPLLREVEDVGDWRRLSRLCGDLSDDPDVLTVYGYYDGRLYGQWRNGACLDWD